jgi:hypothetical protein
MLIELSQNNYNLAIKIIMKNIGITILFLLALNSCSTDNCSKSVAKMDVRNFLALLDHFGLETKTDLDLFHLKDSIEDKLKRNFDFPFCNQLRYSVKYEVLEGVNIPNVVQSQFFECCSSSMMRRGVSCFVLLNCQGKVLFEGEPCEMELIGDKIVSFFKNQNTPSDLKKAMVSLHWDKDVDEMYFRQFMNHIIGGYLECAELQSKKYFNKSIGELNGSELKTLQEMFPFNLCVDFYKIDMTGE